VTKLYILETIKQYIATANDSFCWKETQWIWIVGLQ